MGGDAYPPLKRLGNRSKTPVPNVRCEKPPSSEPLLYLGPQMARCLVPRNRGRSSVQYGQRCDRSCLAQPMLAREEEALVFAFASIRYCRSMIASMPCTLGTCT